jgi:predicted O-linked N-acetylglucosamine transferase (SPINDLY family)
LSNASLDRLLHDAEQALDADDLSRARMLLEQALLSSPDSFDTLHLLATVDIQQGKYPHAIARARHALRLRPDSPGVSFNLALALQLSGNLDEALAQFEQTIRLDPRHLKAGFNRAGLLAIRGDFEGAIQQCRSLTQIAPEWPPGWSGLAEALLGANRPIKALTAIDVAVELDPAQSTALKVKGDILRRLDRLDAAIQHYDAALRVTPPDYGALRNKAGALQLLGRYDDAAACYRAELQLMQQGSRDASGVDLALSQLIRCLREECNWTESAPLEAVLLQRMRNGIGAAEPHLLINLTDDQELQRASARAAWPTPPPPRMALAPRSPAEKLRIGYLSPDFREHVIAHLTAELFEVHDRARFQIFAYSTGPNDRSDRRQRLERAFDVFVDGQTMSDADLAARIAADGVDLLVDLCGHTTGSRLGVLQRKPAPLVAHYLGFPATLGSKLVDYHIADATLIPEADSRFYDEAIVRLPGSFQVNDRKRMLPRPEYTRTQAGLPDNSFVLCAFHGNQKLSHACFDSYLQILSRAPNAVLWLRAAGNAQARLKEAARAARIDADRLIFAERVDAQEHISRQSLADLFLDCWPYGAHTTSSDALWAGLPVLTIAGRSNATRVASSLLRALGLPELIAEDAYTFVETAARFAANPAELHRTRAKLIGARAASSLFDSQAFARKLEGAYEIMITRHRRGEAPSDLNLSAATAC